MKIHKEGHSILIVLLLVLGSLSLTFNMYMPSPWSWVLISGFAILFLLVLQFFRHPKIKATKGDDLVIAPADGKVVVIEETTEDELLKDSRKQISIFMSPLNVHVNRSPIQGTIKKYIYHKGKFLVAWHPKSSTENERTTVAIEHPSGVQLVVRQIAGAVARRIKCYLQEGQQIEQTEEFGFIKFGSRVDIFLPLDAEILVKEEDITKGGVTVLAKLNSKK